MLNEGLSRLIRRVADILLFAGLPLIGIGFYASHSTLTTPPRIEQAPEIPFWNQPT